MISLVGLDGLKPTLQLIRYSQNIAIVNKESLICGWTLIKKKLKKNKTNFIPVDSEHYSIFSLIEKNLVPIEKIYITASGGPFLNRKKNNFSKITVSDALRHPSWRMGKKISIDSATLMNKVFEVIEARNIFDIDYDKISILTHPSSYVHAIVKFNDGLTKFLVHEPDMKIPIYNTIYHSSKKNIKSKNLDLKILNNLNFKKVDKQKFPLIKIISQLPKKNSLYETALISINDYFVFKFLENKIKYTQLIKFIYKYSNHRDFTKFKKNPVKNVNEIYKIRNYVSLKLDTLGI